MGSLNQALILHEAPATPLEGDRASCLTGDTWSAPHLIPQTLQRRHCHCFKGEGPGALSRDIPPWGCTVKQGLEPVS